MGTEGEKRGNSKSNKVVVFVVIMNFVIILGVVAMLYFNGIIKLPVGKEKTVEVIEYVIAMDSFTVNLSTDGRANSYLKTDISFMYYDDSKTELFTEKKSRIRDIIIKDLMEYSSAELLASGGLEYVKTKLKTQVNTVFGEEVVKEIYFTDFLIQ
jgi:flagellar basal body-associated protein FliL